VFEIRNRIANLKTLQANDGTDITRADGIGLLVTHTLEGVQLLDFCLLLRAIAVADGDVHAIANRTSVDTSHSNTSCVAGVIQRRDEHLRRTLKDAGSWNNFQNLVEQIIDIVRRSFEIWTHPAILGRTIDDGEVQLILCRIEVAHQVEDHLIDFLRAAVGLVHLVDHHDGLQTYL